MPKVLEVCVDSFESAMSAISAGASRLELCSSLIEGGLTPTPGLLIQIQKANPQKIPIVCMIRCRGGNFVYTDDEMDVMKQDTQILRENGADGIVFGALLENHDVNMKACRDIIKVAFPLKLTFHRAFDVCRRPSIAAEVIIDTGFVRILTSGKQPNAQLGVKLIQKLIEQVGNRIIIMPGAGINTDNIKFIMENTDANEFHGSFKKEKYFDGNENEDDELITVGEKCGPIYVTDPDLVKQIVHALKNE